MLVEKAKEAEHQTSVLQLELENKHQSQASLRQLNRILSDSVSQQKKRHLNQLSLLRTLEAKGAIETKVFEESEVMFYN